MSWKPGRWFPGQGIAVDRNDSDLEPEQRKKISEFLGTIGEKSGGASSYGGVVETKQWRPNEGSSYTGKGHWEEVRAADEFQPFRSIGKKDGEERLVHEANPLFCILSMSDKGERPMRDRQQYLRGEEFGDSEQDEQGGEGGSGGEKIEMGRRGSARSCGIISRYPSKGR